MSSNLSGADAPAFYTVREAAQILRVDRATLYRAIRDDAFPVIKLRSRYVVPAAALAKLIAEAAELGSCIDVAQMAADRRTAREVERLRGGASW